MRGLHRRRWESGSASVTDRRFVRMAITTTILMPVRLMATTGRGGFRTVSSSAQVRGMAGVGEAGVVGAVVGVMDAAGATGAGITEVGASPVVAMPVVAMPVVAMPVAASLGGGMRVAVTLAADTVAARFAAEVDFMAAASMVAAGAVSMAEAGPMEVGADTGKYFS